MLSACYDQTIAQLQRAHVYIALSLCSGSTVRSHLLVARGLLVKMALSFSLDIDDLGSLLADELPPLDSIDCATSRDKGSNSSLQLAAAAVRSAPSPDVGVPDQLLPHDPDKQKDAAADPPVISFPSEEAAPIDLVSLLCTGVY